MTTDEYPSKRDLYKSILVCKYGTAELAPAIYLIEIEGMNTKKFVKF